MGCGERGEEKDLLTGCIGYVQARGPGKVSREEPGEDHSLRSTRADDHYGRQVGQVVDRQDRKNSRHGSYLVITSRC